MPSKNSILVKDEDEEWGVNSNSERKFQSPNSKCQNTWVLFFLADLALARPARRGFTQINTNPFCVSERRTSAARPK